MKRRRARSNVWRSLNYITLRRSSYDTPPLSSSASAASLDFLAFFFGGSLMLLSRGACGAAITMRGDESEKSLLWFSDGRSDGFSSRCAATDIYIALAKHSSSQPTLVT